jgi:hypothetical protein
MFSKAKIFILSFMFLGSFAYSTLGYCWYDTGHMLIAQIAKECCSDDVVKNVEQQLSYFHDDFPESSTFVTSACFADDIVHLGRSWHLIALPYDSDDILSPEDVSRLMEVVKSSNVVTGINSARKALTDPNESEWNKSIMLRFLVHCVGDIHQPLHCCTLYSEQFPYGDKGGNHFKIKHSWEENLHALWDSGCDINKKDRYQRPLSEDDAEQIRNIAQQIMATYLIDGFSSYDDADPAIWSEEAYRIATEVAHQDISYDGEPSAEYLRRGEEASLRQIALAGYRLAKMLEKIYSEER